MCRHIMEKPFRSICRKQEILINHSYLSFSFIFLLGQTEQVRQEHAEERRECHDDQHDEQCDEERYQHRYNFLDSDIRDTRTDKKCRTDRWCDVADTQVER